jgi:hypothetical protein
LGTGVFQPPPDPPDPSIVPGPGAKTGEDTWGVFRVETLHIGNISTTDPFTITAGTQIWTDGGGGKELVGVFWGESDIKVSNFLDPGGALIQQIEGVDMKFVIWEQADGTFLDPTANSLGSTSRGANPWEYANVGRPADPNASLWLSGESEAGFVGTLAQTEFKGLFSTDTSATIGGNASAYFSMADLGIDFDADTAISAWELGSQNFVANTDYFTNGALAPADVFLNMTTDLNNPTNTPGGFDWTVTNDDDVTGYAIPEPLTMLGLFLGVSGLGGYVRKRLA